jgi:hypothetical protein
MATGEPTATAATTWWIEYADGDRSTDHGSEPEAWEAVVEFQSTDQRRQPAWLFSSDGQRFVIPAK